MDKNLERVVKGLDPRMVQLRDAYDAYREDGNQANLHELELAVNSVTSYWDGCNINVEDSEQGDQTDSYSLEDWARLNTLVSNIDGAGVDYLRSKVEMTVSTFANELEVSQSTVTRWVNESHGLSRIGRDKLRDTFGRELLSDPFFEQYLEK